MNKTATFKKIFKPIENETSILFRELPENTVAEKIRKLRLMEGLTQRQFAKKCDIGYSSLCKYETGHNINLSNIRKICDTFKLDYTYLK